VSGSAEETLRPPKERDRVHANATARAAARRVLKANPNFLGDLKRCNDLTSLYDWAAAFDVEVNRHSRLAFRQLYNSGGTLEDLLGALGDSALNNPDNLDFLLRQQTKRTLPIGDIETIGQCFKRTLFLGQWPEAQISLIMDFVLHISTVNSDEDLKCRFVASVFEGLESSVVLGIKKLKHSQIEILLKAITCGPFTSISQDLGSRLIKTLEPSQLTCLTGSVSLFVQKCFKAQAIMEESARVDAKDMASIPNSIASLRDLPQCISYTVVLDASRALVNHTARLPRSNGPLLKLLDRWWSWVRNSRMIENIDQGASERQLEHLLAGKSLDIIATYLRHFDDSTIAQFILRGGLGTLVSLDDQGSALDLFQQLCETTKSNSPFASMLRTAHHFSDIPDKTMQRLLSLLQILNKSESIPSIIVDLRNANIRISEDVILYIIKSDLYWDRHCAENIFCVYRELPLERCPELARKMIKNRWRLPPEALWQYLSRRPIHGCHAPLHTRRTRARLLEKMADAYSFDRHLTHRMAFYYAYKCYIQHMRDDLGPLSVKLLLALTRTGVIQPLESGKWVSTERLRWLLRLIQEVEGSPVAESVDRTVYEWRGIIVKQLKAQERSRQGREEPPLCFRFRNEWDSQEGRVYKVLEPLTQQRHPPHAYSDVVHQVRDNREQQDIVSIASRVSS